MPFVVDRMSFGDVSEVMAIEKDSFTTPWPSNAYKKELGENVNAHYLVLRLASPEHPDQPLYRPAQPERRGFLGGFLLPLSRTRPPLPAPPDVRTMAGYAGLWLVIDEAHVTTIAVRPEYRGKGLGELLLVALTEIALDINARWLTLEVRVSNTTAQALYRKYGFKPAGVRPKYYSDNREDALIMWTDEIHSPAFQDRFTALRADLRERLIQAGDLAPFAEGLAPQGRRR
ncbi:MAG TPA: ribosomal protein S18-alanine N-acetyltransferase [Chloroflexota bacterium]|nr:ribosomal protein S18-alanine N-acetyltransferase [Chloroflexota bacterium]